MNDNPRILVIRGGALGDFIQTLPAIAALRQRWPGARIEVLGYPQIAALAIAPHLADAVRSIESRALAAFFVPNGPLDPPWRQYLSGFDLVISYLYDPDQVFAQNLRGCGVGQLLLGDPRPSSLHAAEHYCEPLRSLGLVVRSPLPHIVPDSAARQRADELLGTDQCGPWVALHPGSGSARKNWAVAKFAAVARWLVASRNVRVIVLQGEVDAQPVQELLVALAPEKIRLLMGQEVTTVAALIQRCCLYLGNDSGITHLAAAVGTPCIALFGPASNALWHPRGPQVRVVEFGEEDLEQVRQGVAQLVPSRCGASHLP